VRTLFRLAFAAVVVAMLAIAAAYFYLRMSVPKFVGEIIAIGIKESIEILRDAYGVPHFRAKSL